MLNKFFGLSAVAAAALLVGATPTLAHDGRDDLCGGVIEVDDDMVMTGAGKPLLLGSSAPCPQETAAAAAVETETATETAEAVPASLPNDGMVYFGLDSDQLDAEDEALLDEIIAAVKENGPSKIVVRGHADRSGPDEYNMGLSERRAEAIAAALVAAGIPADSVRTMGRGETDPAVATDDGVAMRQNRRAAIQSDE